MTSHLSTPDAWPAAAKRDFPILERSSQGKRLVYLDSAATSQKPRAVLEAVDAYYRRSNANVHRGVYELAEEATALYEAVRSKVAAFMGATPQETIFVRNATEAINLVAYAWGRRNLNPGDAIVLTPLEHHSNLVPWQILAEEREARLCFTDLDEDGSIDVSSLERILSTERVKLVTVAYVSNVLGTVTPVQVIARLAHAAGALVLADAAQAVPHRAVDVRELDVDFLAFTGHKMLAPMGIGVLYGRRSILDAMPPFLAGGEMIRRVGTRSSTWNELPWKFEAGTPSVGDAIGLGAAIDYLASIGMEAIQAHEQRLTGYALEQLEAVEGITIYGPRVRGALVAFSLADVHPHDLASLLDEQGIAIRAGHHCAQPLHEALGIAATARASFYLYNDEADVDALVEGLRTARRVFLR